MHEFSAINWNRDALYFFGLHVEQEVQNIPIMHHIFLTLRAHLAMFFRTVFAFELDEVREGNGLRADEAFFKIGVNRGGGAGCGVAFVDGPGAHFFDAGGEVRL